ncbi:MAG: phosphopantetheine-binding protein [Planctomycetaceae bacterium]|nr:phosphopantetheine-binding protein [Planctomycetaceae bacterium]
MESVENIGRGLLQWCNKRLQPVSPIAVETDLLDQGYLDSLFIMAAVAHVEEQYGIAIDSADISPQHFCSVRALATFVAEQGAS